MTDSGNPMPVPREFRFIKQQRLLKQAEFDRVFQSKMYAADQTLVINAAANDLGFARLGLSIGRKVGNAVVRNGWKRKIREAFRLHQHDFPLGIDLIIRPRQGGECDIDLIRDSLCGLVRRLHKKVSREEPNPQGEHQR